jgi:hypothetical protein
MSHSNHWLKWTVVLALLVLVGCASTPPVEIPTPTPTLTFTPSPTLTPVPSATPTLIPTLTRDDAETKMLDLMASNGNCHLPCFWGITPGESTLTDTKTILAPFSSFRFTEVVGRPPYAFFTYWIEELYFSVGIDYDSNDKVSNVNFAVSDSKIEQSTNGPIFKPIYNSKYFSEQIFPYTLLGVLSDQGIPEAVVITTNGDPDPHQDYPGFYITLLSGLCPFVH